MKTSIKNQLLILILIAGLGLIPVGRLAAQTFTTLHDFDGGSGGPWAGLLLSGNTLYGTTPNTVFEVNTNGSGFMSTFFVYYGLAESYGSVILSGNTLYGTVNQYGTNNTGAVFAANISTGQITDVHSFSAGSGSYEHTTNSDGAYPYAGLILSGNSLYGTTTSGGSSGNGTVFAVNPDGTSFTNLHSFTATSGFNFTNSDGASPQGSLILSGNTLYGTTVGGGGWGAGTVFAINTNGTGFTILHSFSGNDGSEPWSGLVLSGNILYGTTYSGGTQGLGTVFAISTDGSGFTNLYSFTDGGDGAFPQGSLILSGNTLYGTAAQGGSFGSGTVFSINTDGTGFMTLHSFTAMDPITDTNSDGALPQAGLVLSGNTLYGGTPQGGSLGFGTVFSIFFPLMVTTTSLPNGTNDMAYSQTLLASHGQTPYSWTNLSGTLPLGLMLATNGVISGTPTTNGTFNFTVQVTDSLSATATQALALTVGAPPSVTIIQPTNNVITLTDESSLSLAVTVAGTGPFSYQWQLNGTNLANSIITTVAGGGDNYPGDGGMATNAEFDNPEGMAVDTTGNLFFADPGESVIREVGTNGIITTVTGNESAGYGYSGDGGAATNAKLNWPIGVAVDAIGNLFIADSGNNVIREVGTNGIIITMAGIETFGNGYSGDGGAATNARLSNPSGVAVDAIGNLFIADSYNNVIRMVDANGVITTVAGNGYGAGTGHGGYSGDGGMAMNSELFYPSGVAADASGNLFIADYYNNVIRKVGADGIITTAAGNGYGAGTDIGGYSGDGGTATNAELYLPTAVAMDTSGSLFIADTDNTRIRKVVFSGPTLVVDEAGIGNAGAYDVVVSSPYGSVTSSVVNLTITLPVALAAPQISVGNNQFSFLLSGPSGSNYVLEVSTNLLNWNPVSTSTIPVSGSITLSNAISGYNRGFYRVHLQ